MLQQQITSIKNRGFAASSLTDYAVLITPNIAAPLGGNNINHGYFWKRDIAHTNFFWEGWVQPKASAEYFISDGHGGSHALLLGFDGNPTNLKITGNVWDTVGAALTSFSSIDTIPAETLHHVAVGWDGSNIKVYLDGVATKVVAFTGTRGNTGQPQDGILYVGGSDHSNYNGWIYRIRGFEGTLPFASGLPTGYFVPEQRFRSAFSAADSHIFAQFLADYTKPNNVIPDLGSGYGGGTHPGALSFGNDYTVFAEGLKKGSAAFLPTFEVKTFEQSAYLGTVAGDPTGFTLFHDFNELDRVPAWETVPITTIVAPTGQTWSSGFGILSGNLVPLANSSSNAWIESGCVDGDIDVTFTNANTALKMAYLFRGSADLSNYLYIATGVNQGLYDIYLGKIGTGAGILATAVQALANESFSTLRVKALAGAVTVWVDGVQKMAATGVSYQTGTKVGASFDPLNRLGKITAIAAV